MTDIELLLSDEYAAFAAKLGKIRETLKTKEEEMKKVFAAFKAEKEALTAEAVKLSQEWEKTVQAKAKKA